MARNLIPHLLGLAVSLGSAAPSAAYDVPSLTRPVGVRALAAAENGPVPAPKPATRPRPRTGAIQPPKTPVRAPNEAAASAARRDLLARVATWGIQLQEFDASAGRHAPFDMLVTDASSGAKGSQAFTARDIAALKAKPGGGERLVLSYLSIGEAEDYRPDYFTTEYMTEDAPDWLMSENKQWKGNRRIRFCEEGWQKTILGDEDGRNLYNSLEPSPLYKLIELGFDGVYLDRVDVYSEVKGQCPDAARRMVDFVARLAAHARKKNPNFVVILQNAEELLRNPLMVKTIDAVAKEDLFYGADHTERENDAGMIKTTLENLAFARAAGKPVLVLDYLKDPAKRAADRGKIEAQGFIPYFGPRKLDALWLSQAEH